MNIIIADFKRGFKERLRYKEDFFLSTAIQIAVLFTVFISSKGYSYKDLDPSYSRSMVFFTYLLWTFSMSGMNASSYSVQGELLRGTLYQKLFSSLPLQILSFSRLLQNISIQLLATCIIFPIAHFIFKVPFVFNFWLIPTYIFTIFGMYGIGLAIGGFTLYYKQSIGINTLLQFTMYFFGNIHGDGILLFLENIFPLASGNGVIHRLFSGEDFTTAFIRLIFVSVIWFILGYIIFQKMLNKAKETGNLLMY